MIVVILSWESREKWLKNGEYCHMFSLVKFNLMLVVLVYASLNFLVMIILYIVILFTIRRYVSNNLIAVLKIETMTFFEGKKTFSNDNES